MNVSKFLEATFKLPLNSIWHLTFDIFNLCVKTGIFETILQDTKERTFFGAPFFGPSRGNFLSAEFLARIRTVGPQTASMNFASTWLTWQQQMGGAMVRFLDGGAESATCGTSPPSLPGTHDELMAAAGPYERLLRGEMAVSPEEEPEEELSPEKTWCAPPL